MGAGRKIITLFVMSVPLWVRPVDAQNSAAAPSAAQPPTVPTDSSVEALALDWFAHMEAGQIDRAQLTAAYNSQLTDGAVKDMAQYLKDHDYSVRPSSAQVLENRKSGDQTFYVVKLVFPRGDAASLMFGFDAAGKITGISLMSMAGD